MEPMYLGFFNVKNKKEKVFKFFEAKDDKDAEKKVKQQVRAQVAQEKGKTLDDVGLSALYEARKVYMK